MKIYKIEYEKNEFDHYLSIDRIIVADSEKEVRRFAKSMSGKEGESVWDKAKIKEYGQYTGHRKKSFHIISSRCEFKD
jgi:hypothetical protein